MQYKTPGVYIVEKNAFPNSVVEVATAIPVFIGYTEKAADGPVDKSYTPTYIASLADYIRYFGGAPTPSFSLSSTLAVAQDAKTRFFLYHSVMLYFANGGGPAYVISVGSYANATANGKASERIFKDLLKT